MTLFRAGCPSPQAKGGGTYFRICSYRPALARRFRPTGRRSGMDFDDEKKRGPGLGSSEAVPPADWTGFGGASGMEALYAEHRSELTRYLRRRAPRQDVGEDRKSTRLNSSH